MDEPDEGGRWPGLAGGWPYAARYISRSYHDRAAICLTLSIAYDHTPRPPEMHLLTRPRSQPSPSPTTTPELELSSPPPSPRPKVQGLKFFRTLSTRPSSTSDADGLHAWETSPRAAAKALRGWFGSPPSPNSSKAEEQEEYKWRHLGGGKEWEGFLKVVEEDGGLDVPPPKSPTSPRRIREENKKRRRRSDPKSTDWDAAMLAHARSLGYSCPSSPSDFGSNGSVESLASGSSEWSSTHTPSMSVFSPSIRKATYYRPMRRRSSSYSAGGRETKRPIASEDVVARYFAGVGPTEGSMLEGYSRGSKPKVMEVPKRNEAQTPEQQNALQLEVEARPGRTTQTLGSAEPISGASAPVSRTTRRSSPLVTEAYSQSPRDMLCPPSPARMRSQNAHRTFRPSPLGSRHPSSVDYEDDKRSQDLSTDLETVEVWSRRRRNTTDGLTTIWEAGSNRENIF